MLDQLLVQISERSKKFIGYPTAIDFDYSPLFPLLQYSLNNVGDPFLDSHSDMNTRKFEREVVSWYADLFNAPATNWWGYVTNGGSEGNLYALYLARELYPNGMVYYSEATHYSVQKNIHLLNMESIVIRSKENGEMDYEDLSDMIQLHRHQPAIILANIGTTMTEAKDDLSVIKTILKKFAIKSSYIHCDAALAGPFLAAIGKGNSFDFSAGADSIAISGHKFIGSPIPCGVVIVKKNYKERIARSIPYIGTLDTTITGSRNAITPVFMWYAIKNMGLDGMKMRALASIELAAYTVEKMKANGFEAWRNQDAITVVFPKPSERICHEWQLASDQQISHLICMPGITKDHIDRFIEDMKKSKDSSVNLNLGGVNLVLN
jgi:histidine decarboxylase